MKEFIKTICCIAIIFFLGSNVNAQEGVARFGVKAGMNYSGTYGVDNLTKSQIRLNTGITLDFKLSSSMYLLTGLDYSIKGGKSRKPNKNDYHNAMVTQADKPVYLQLPLHVGYKFDVSGFNIMPHIGFYMAYGIGGKAEYLYEPLDDRPAWTDKIDFFGVNVGKFDYGTGIGANVEYNKFVLDFGHDWGLRKFAKEYNDGKSKNLYLTLGYKF